MAHLTGAQDFMPPNCPVSKTKQRLRQKDVEVSSVKINKDYKTALVSADNFRISGNQR